MRFSALNKPVPLAWRILLSNEILYKILIIKARSLRKFLLQRRAAIPENFVLDVKYLYRVGYVRHTARADLKLHDAHLGPNTLPIFNICCPNS